MTGEETRFAKRLVDLSRQAQAKDIAVFSDFLNLNELNIFHTCISDLYGGFTLSGGYEFAERQMIAFLPDALVFPVEFPMVCCKVEPLNKRFAEPLTHRDVLGSLMNLGIERGKIGDILVQDDLIYFFCHKQIHGFILEELTRIRHTAVAVMVTEPGECDIQPNLEECHCIVTSNRLDALLASMCRLSRSQAADSIKKGLVFINGKEITSTSYSCKENDIISFRGTGRFRFKEAQGETKKGRIKILYYKYI